MELSILGSGFDIRVAKFDLSSKFTLHAHDKAVCTVSYHPLAPNLLATGSTNKMVILSCKTLGSVTQPIFMCCVYVNRNALWDTHFRCLASLDNMESTIRMRRQLEC
ncbi:unnamed protein product [Ilex paraguariensis]|uniref:Uncharacterized protein n=1 Tax=Ilex paraguariensis TaxID=185542 RepID=A0ABC8S1J8_9AQUA